MDSITPERFAELEKKVDLVYRSTEKTRRYMWFAFIISVVVFVVPLLGLIIVVPMFVQTYIGAIDTL